LPHQAIVAKNDNLGSNSQLVFSTRISMSTITAITDVSFEEDVINASLPVLVDFWAEWCGPCKMLTPVLESISDEFADKLKITKLNVDENPETAPKFGVRGIPTLILFKEGQVVATKVGALTKSQLVAFLNDHI
jgi:thioredoxin 1